MLDRPPGFDGIPFGATRTFDEDEAATVLASFMSALRTKLASSTTLPMIDNRPSHVRRGTDIGWAGAWDVIPFRFGGSDDYTKHPHLAAWISEFDIGIEVVLPNAARPYWRRLRSVDQARFFAALCQVSGHLAPRRTSLGAGLWEPRLVIDVLQRHFHARRRAVDDGRLRFDLDVLCGGGNPAVKSMSVWLQALRAVLAEHGRANLQLDLTVSFPLLDGSISRGPQFLQAAVASAEALHPFIELLRGDEANADPPVSLAESAP